MSATNHDYFAWSYPDEKLTVAIDALTTSFAPNWQRMAYALDPLTRLMPAHFPDQDLYERVEKLLRHATAYGPLMIGDRIYYGSIENTLRKRKRVTFERMADEIVAIANEISQRRGEYQE